MNKYKDLEKKLQMYKKKLMLNSNGELLRPFRKEIELILLKENDYKKNKLVLLYLLCVDKVLENEQEFIYNDNFSKEIIEIILKYINTEFIDREDLKKVHGYVEFIFYRGIYITEISRYFSIYMAIGEVLNSIYYDRLEVDNRLDSNLDVYSYESDYLCSVAYSGSYEWEKKDVEKRREFWNWYLDEAIVKAINFELDKCSNINMIVEKSSKYNDNILDYEKVFEVIKYHGMFLEEDINGKKGDFMGKVLAGLVMPAGDLSFINFQDSSLAGAGLCGNYLRACNFQNTNLGYSFLDSIICENIIFDNTNFKDCVIDGCKFINCDFTNSNLEESQVICDTEFVDCKGISKNAYDKMTESASI